MTFAFDRSARTIDADGRLHVGVSHISKAMVSPYYGREIPGYESLGLAPDKVYRLFRDPVELERGADTFARLPILSEHVPVTVDSPQPDLVVGAIGSNVKFNAPYLDADLCVWDGAAIAGIEAEKVRELSCAYRYVPVMESGEYEGQAYDGRMTEIKGNHLALVEVGRAGSDVIVADENPFKKETAIMKKTKLGTALLVALSAASPVLAADSALANLVGSANRKTFKKDQVKAKLLAMDENMDPQQVDNVIDAILDVEQDPMPTETPMAAADETPADKVRAMLSGKVDEALIAEICAMMMPAAAADGYDEKADMMKKDDVNAAMDSMRKELREAEQARRDVRQVVGDLDVAMDSAEAVYGFALDHMKVDRTDVTGVSALRALFKVANTNKPSNATPTIAQDGAGLAAKFPNAARFGKV